MSITFSSCFYIIESKFDPSQYVQWMNNFFSIVNNFNLVVFADENSCKYIDTKHNPKIKIIIKQLTEFYNYKYKNNWIENHTKNFLLNDKSEWKTSWKLNMLWSEKIWFVKETIDKKYFETDFYGWCDIGYFRNDAQNTNTQLLSHWPNSTKINNLNKNKIYYACINNNIENVKRLHNAVNNKNQIGLPVIPIPNNQCCFAGGFFILYKDKIDVWCQLYNDKLDLYFKNKCLVKDDQIILTNCILSNLKLFALFRENIPNIDNWFMFQRKLI